MHPCRGRVPGPPHMGTLVSRGAGNAYYINAQEFIEVLLAVKTYSTGKEHLNILIQTENMTAKAYVTGFAKRYLFHTFDIPANKMS